jgi:hypothetical protein
MIEKLHKIWGVEKYATQPEFTCYESVEDDLNRITMEDYEKDPTGTIDKVLAIYRSINVVPMVFYTEEGLINAISRLAATKANGVVNNTIPLGNNQGQAINRFLFPNMMTAEARGDGRNGLIDRFNDDAKLRRAIRICFEHRSPLNLSPRPIRTALELVHGGNIQNFKSLNARVIAEYLCPVLFGNVYDYSSGYGGRLLGITTSNMRYNYHGIDPNTETFAYLNYLNDLIDECVGNRGSLTCAVSEEFVPEDIDLAFSSPPYFNLEKYTDEPTQCMNRYKTMDEWFEGYVEPTMKTIYKSLNSDGIFASNIADYKLSPKKEFLVVDRWCEMATKIGFKQLPTIRMLINARPGDGGKAIQGNQKFEGVYVFSK